MTEPLGVLGGIAGAMFSGGVGEYVYGREERDFGDLGRRFGRAVRERIEAGRFPFALLPAGECIRATALGASEYNPSCPETRSMCRARASSCPEETCR